MFIRVLIYSLLRLLDVVSIAVFAYAIMSWFAQGTNVYYWFARILEPLLSPFRALSRKIMQRVGIPIDLSCWLAIIAIRILSSAITRFYYFFL